MLSNKLLHVKPICLLSTAIQQEAEIQPRNHATSAAAAAVDKKRLCVCHVLMSRLQQTDQGAVLLN